MPRSRSISLRTASDAVPVNARMQGEPWRVFSRLRHVLARFRYDVLKSWPHSETQWASSIAQTGITLHEHSLRSASRNPSICKRSGDMNTKLKWPDSIARCKKPLFFVLAVIPSTLSAPMRTKLSTWSSINDVIGSMTITVPGII